MHCTCGYIVGQSYRRLSALYIAPDGSLLLCREEHLGTRLYNPFLPFPKFPLYYLCEVKSYRHTVCKHTQLSIQPLLDLPTLKQQCSMSVVMALLECHMNTENSMTLLSFAIVIPKEPLMHILIRLYMCMHGGG